MDYYTLTNTGTIPMVIGDTTIAPSGTIVVTGDERAVMLAGNGPLPSSAFVIGSGPGEDLWDNISYTQDSFSP